MPESADVFEKQIEKIPWLSQELGTNRKLELAKKFHAEVSAELRKFGFFVSKEEQQNRDDLKRVQQKLVTRIQQLEAERIRGAAKSGGFVGDDTWTSARDHGRPDRDPKSGKRF